MRKNELKFQRQATNTTKKTPEGLFHNFLVNFWCRFFSDSFNEIISRNNVITIDKNQTKCCPIFPHPQFATNSKNIVCPFRFHSSIFFLNCDRLIITSASFLSHCGLYENKQSRSNEKSTRGIFRWKGMLRATVSKFIPI